MKVRVLSKVPTGDIGNLKGKELVSKSDGVGFTSYEIRIPRTSRVQLSPIYGVEYNHIYYVIEGMGAISLPGGKTREVQAHLVIALTGEMEAVLAPKSSIRMFVTYVNRSPDGPQPQQPVVTRLSDIIGTDRDTDSDWARSRHLLRKDDGFNLSVHNTLAFKNQVTPLHYEKHYEASYFMKGDVAYKWGEGGSRSHTFRQTNIADGNGCMFLADKNEPHEVHVLSMDSEAICVFYPPLVGTEE